MNSILIGLGNVGLNYDFDSSKNILTHASALSKNAKINLLFAVDKSSKQRKKFKKKYKAATIKRLEEIKKRSDIELAIISTNTSSHLHIINKLLIFEKLKVILIEKPCGKNLNELLKIYKLCKRNKIKLFINYNRLYDKKYYILNSYIKKLKKFKGIAHYSRGIKNNCSHILSILSGLNLQKTSIKIIKHGLNPDFVIRFLKGEIIFVNSVKKNISNNEIEIHDKKYKISSKNEINNFEIFKIKKDNLIKNNFRYSLIDKFKFDVNYSQRNVMHKIISSNNVKLNNFINKTALDVSLILERVIKTNNFKE